MVSYDWVNCILFCMQSYSRKKGVYNILIGINYFIIIKFLFFISPILKILMIKSNVIDRSLGINQSFVVHNLICIIIVL